MYIKTPKRYRGTSRRSVFPFKRFLFIGILIGLIAGGIYIYQHRGVVAPIVSDFVSTTAADAGMRIATMTAPTPTPTPDPRNNLIEANNYWTQGAVQDALALYRGILPAVPNDGTIHARTTLALVAQGDYNGALDMAEQTVTADPYASDAWAIRAWTLDWNGRYGEAITSALHARELDPNNPRALAFLAEAYFSNGQTDRALLTIEDAIERDPNSPEAYRARGIVRWQGTFELDSAMNDLQTAYNIAQETNPAFASVIAIDIANLEIASGNVDGAISILDSLLETNPQNTQAIYTLGSVYFRNLGSYEQSLNYFLRCVDINAESVGCNYMLGRSQERLDQLQAAADSFARAIEFGSADPYHYWWAGRSQISLGNCTGALDYLRTGYDMAISRTNEQLVADYEAILPLCDANFGSQTEPDDTQDEVLPELEDATPLPELDDPENTT